VLRRGRAVRTLLHRPQFVSDGRRTRLYRQQQPVEGAITSEAKREVARAPLRDCPKVELLLIVDGSRRERVRNLAEATAEFPATPISDARLGATMLYSSGATGRPKGVLRPLPDQAPDEPLSALAARLNVWRFREGQVYLSPAPLYHSAPLAGVGGTIRRGGTVVVMELRAGRVV
jgi:long-chain acyl-CoA synthetase